MLVAFIQHLPILTTLLCGVLGGALYLRARTRASAPHLRWWLAGVFTYGLGTAIESSISLFGNAVWLTQCWYAAGAVLGGYPLAQGSVHLHCSKRMATLLTRLTLPLVVGLVVLVLLSPTRLDQLDPMRPSGAVLGWEWIRWLTPIVNVYALIFLVGSAGYSALYFLRMRSHGALRRAAGNLAIAVGGLLPAVGGVLAKSGRVEALYVAECLGILGIGWGFYLCTTAQDAREGTG